MKLTLSQITKLDQDNRKLVRAWQEVKLRVGLELGERLKRFRDENLFKKLDVSAYPNFKTYLDSIELNYKTATEAIGLYESFILAGGKTIEELQDVGYHKLTIIKPSLFKKEGSEYKLIKSKAEMNKWINHAASDISQEDLKLLRIQEEVGEHPHDWKEIHYRVCTVCRIREGVFNVKEKTEKK